MRLAPLKWARKNIWKLGILLKPIIQAVIVNGVEKAMGRDGNCTTNGSPPNTHCAVKDQPEQFLGNLGTD